MSHELKEPRQAGDPTRLESNDAALTDKSTGIPTERLNLARPERLDPSLPLRELAQAASARRREMKARAVREHDAAIKAGLDYAADDLPSVFDRLDSLTPDATAEVGRVYSAGERIGWQAGFDDAMRVLRASNAAAYAEGQADLAAALYAEQLKWQEDTDRRLAASLASGSSYPELCELRGESDRADRARQLYAVRGIA